MCFCAPRSPGKVSIFTFGAAAWCSMTSNGTLRSWSSRSVELIVVGGPFRRASRPVDVVWAWVPGTYEEYMASRVGERMEMMKVLLGAGERLAASLKEQGTADLGQYQFDFAP